MSSVKEIARIAGVSLATASQILRNPQDKRYAKDTRQKVVEISQRVNYTPSSIAKALITKKTLNVGLVGTDWLDPHHQIALAEAGRIVSAKNYNLMVGATTSYKSWYHMLLERKVDLLITVGFWPTQKDDLSFLAQYRHQFAAIGPTPIFDQSPPYWGLSVSWDEIETGVIIADHFLNKTHRHLAILSGDGVSNRTAGFVKRVRQEGIYPWVVLTSRPGTPDHAELLEDFPSDRIIRTSPYSGQDRPSLGALQLAILRAIHPEVTGVFCRNELYAIGAIRQATDQGLTVPGDISIAGHNDCSEFFPTYPVLTTIRTPIVQAVRTVLEKFFTDQLVKGAEPINLFLKGHLIEGATVGLPRNGV